MPKEQISAERKTRLRRWRLILTAAALVAWACLTVGFGHAWSNTHLHQAHRFWGKQLTGHIVDGNYIAIEGWGTYKFEYTAPDGQDYVDHTVLDLVKLPHNVWGVKKKGAKVLLWRNRNGEAFVKGSMIMNGNDIGDVRGNPWPSPAGKYWSAAFLFGILVIFLALLTNKLARYVGWLFYAPRPPNGSPPPGLLADEIEPPKPPSGGGPEVAELQDVTHPAA